MSDEGIKKLFGEFITNAEAAGLPVAFLKTVRDKYSVREEPEGGNDNAQPVLKRLSLMQSTMDQAGNMALARPVGEAPMIQTVYHESTHAWLNIMAADPVVKDLKIAGERYYKNSPLDGGRTATDEGRIYQEAAASYVGHRAASWWLAMEGLTDITNVARDWATKDPKLADPKRRASLVRIAKKYKADYGQAMGQRVFGYQEVGWLWKKDQIESKMTIFSQLKDYCDRVILEGKIADQFQMNAAVMARWTAIAEQLPEVNR